MAMFFKPFTRATVRYFDLHDFDEAVEWIRAELAVVTSSSRTSKRAEIRNLFQTLGLRG
jgi:hypothetical protein